MEYKVYFYLGRWVWLPYTLVLLGNVSGTVRQPGCQPPFHRLTPGGQIVDTTVERNRGETGASSVSWGKNQVVLL